MARNAGEEIYESLGEDRSIIEDQPIVIETKESENIVSESLSPPTAFEYFHGKIYQSSQSSKTEYSLVDKVEKRVESPFQRFARLRAEVAELQSDIAIMIQDSTKHHSSESVWSTLQTETSQLLDNLDNLNGSLSKLSEQSPKPFNIEELHDLASCTTSHTHIQPGHIIPESHTSIPPLEIRVAALENLLGSGSNLLDLEGVVGVTVHGRSYPLLDKLTMLERKVNMLDPATLETIRGRAHTLKSELEEIQRERIRSGGAAHKVLEAAKKVETLYDNVAHITGVSNDLPTVILRLKTLESLHHEAASFNVRLCEASNILARLASEVDSNTETLAALKTGFVENMAIFQNNLAQVRSTSSSPNSCS